MQKIEVECSVEHDDRGIPVLVVKENGIDVLVLDYYSVQELANYISEYLIIVEKYYAD